MRMEETLNNQLAQNTHLSYKRTKVQGHSLGQGSSLACPESYSYNPWFILTPLAALTSGAGEFCIFISVTKWW